MKFSYMTAALLGLTQACSHSEQFWKNDPGCNGEPFEKKTFNDDMNVCIKDGDGGYRMVYGCFG